MTTSTTTAVRETLFEYKNRWTLGMPRPIQFIMFLVFGFPALVPLMTWKLVAETPWIIVLWIACCFPLTVLYVLGRLMSRYGLRVFSNGDVEIIFPFSRVSIAGNNLKGIVAERFYVEATKGYVTWIRFVDAGGHVLASVSPIAFPSETWSGFVESLRQAKPGLDVRL